MNFQDLGALFKALASDTAFSVVGRSMRLRHVPGADTLLSGLLLPQRAVVREGIGTGLEVRLTCLTPTPHIHGEELVGQALALELRTDRGDMRSFPGVVTEVAAGRFDDALRAVHLVVRDPFSLLAHTYRLRTFHDKRVPEVIAAVLDPWIRSTPLSRSLTYTMAGIDFTLHPRRACFIQAPDESDLAFVTRLAHDAGLFWFVRPAAGEDAHAIPLSELVFCDIGANLPPCAAGQVEYHRRDTASEADTIDHLAQVHRLVPAGVELRSYDHEAARVDARTGHNDGLFGAAGEALAETLRQTRVTGPHLGDSWDDLNRLAQIRADTHRYRAALLQGHSGVRQLAPGTRIVIEGYPGFKGRSEDERDHVIVAVEHVALNNLPAELHAAGLQLLDDADLPPWARGADGARRLDGDAEHRYVNRFEAVHKSSPIRPALPDAADGAARPPQRLSGVVIAVDGDGEITTDALGRCRVRLHGGEPGEDTTAWVRHGAPWAGRGHGFHAPLRAGTEVDLELRGHDRLTIVHCHYNGATPPPRPAHQPALPGNRAQMALVSRELQGARQSFLSFDDTPGQLMAQLATDAGAAALSLGELTTPRRDGEANARGVGAALHTRAQFSARGEQGVYISAESPQSPHHLDRGGLLGMLDLLQDIHRQVAELATAHHGQPLDTAGLERLARRLRHWHHGDNTAPDAPDGGAPLVAVSGPAGVGLLSGDNLTLGAQGPIDAISGGNAQFTSGGKTLIHAGAGFEVHAQAHGLRLVTAADHIDIESHNGDIRLTAARRLIVQAGEEVVLQAPRIRQVAQGAQVDVGGGQITQQSTGSHTLKSSSFEHLGPGDGAPPGLELPATALPADERFVVRLRGSGLPAADRRYRIELDDGGTLEGRTDAQGRTALAQTDALRVARVTVFND